MPMGVFSEQISHDLDAKQLNYPPKEWCKAAGVYESQKHHFPSVLTVKMANNQLPPGTFTTMERLQRWAFTPVTSHPLQDFRSKMGPGRLPRVDTAGNG